MPDREAPGFNPAAATRIIKLVEAQVDPLEPPKFAHKKVPGGPPDAPVPALLQLRLKGVKLSGQGLHGLYSLDGALTVTVDGPLQKVRAFAAAVM